MNGSLLGKMQGPLVGRMLGAEDAIFAADLPLAFTSFMTAPTTLPTSATFKIPTGSDGFAVFVGNAYDVHEHLFGYYELHVYDGTNQHTICLTPWAATIVKLTEGATISIGCSDAWGNPVSVPITFMPGAVPVTFSDPDGTPVTGTINTDFNYPLEWEAAVTRVSTGAGDYFLIDWTSETKHSVCWVKHKLGATWSPPQAVKLTPGRKVPVLAITGDVAIMRCQAGTMVVEATDGSTLDTSTAGERLTWSDEFTPLRTVNIANATQLAAALADLRNGDDLVLSDQTLTLLAAINLNDLTLSFRIRSASNDPALVTIVGDILIDFASGSSGTCYLQSIAFASNPGSTTGFQLHGGQFRVEKCTFARLSGAITNLTSLDFLSQNCLMKFFDTSFAAVSGSVSDLFDLSNAGAVDNGGLAHFIGCSYTGAGAAANDNLATCHDGSEGVWWGGTFQNRGGGPSIVSTNESASKMHLVGCVAFQGTSTGNQFGETSRPLGNVLFCDLRDINANNGFVFRVAVGCYAQATSGVTNLFNEAADTGAYLAIGTVFEQTGGANGTAMRLRADSFQLIGNEYLGWARGWRIDDPNSTTSQGQDVFFNRDNNASGTDVGKNTQSPLTRILFNILAGTPSGGAGTSPKNTAVDGNLSVGTIDADLTGTANRSTITPLLNSTGSPNNLDADGTPQSSSNCDWSTFASGLSGPNQQILRDRIGARRVGWMGVKGDVLVSSITKAPRGPRLRQQTGELLYPVSR